MKFKRALNLQTINGSAFLFGPRMTGKSFLLREMKTDLFINLLDPEIHLDYQKNPGLFWQQLLPLNAGSVVVVDEIQRVPALLDYVQKGIEEKSLRFLLSGSSARKLRRGGANLLGGRARDLKLHPLTHQEIGEQFDLANACHFGTLPKISDLLLDSQTAEARHLLKSYYTTYIKEEIQAEAITRNVGAFQRFLGIAAQSNGQVIEFANVSRECAVPMSSVKEYYSILEDTLLGEFLWPWDRSERKKARPKFYFFDCGVVRSIQNRLTDPPTPLELGFLFETWFVREATRLRDYQEKEAGLSFWREGKHEIDLLVTKSHGPVLAIECKSGQADLSTATVRAFQNQFPKVPLIVASLQDTVPRRLSSGVDVLPWKQALQRFESV